MLISLLANHTINTEPQHQCVTRLLLVFWMHGLQVASELVVLSCQKLIL